MKNNYLNFNKQHSQALPVAVFKCCFVMILFIFSIGKTSSALIINHTNNKLSCHLATYSSAPLHLPIEFAVVSKEVEDFKEDESQDDHDDELNTFFSSNLIESKFHLYFQRNLFAQLNLSVRNRTTISLFILHHSWKSFLS